MQIFGNAVEPLQQDVILECSPELVGDSLSVHLSQRRVGAVWTLEVVVHIAQGWFFLGSITTVSPLASGKPSARTVCIANCPGAIGWKVIATCNTNGEIADLVLQSSKCGATRAGVVNLEDDNGAVIDVNIVSPIPLPVAVVSFLPNPLPVTGAFTDTPWSEIFSTALANSFIVKAAAGTIRSITLRLDGVAASATYYVQLWNLAAVPADATAISLVNGLAAPMKQVHITNVDDLIRYDFDEGGVLFSAGCCLNLSSTEFTKTAVAGNLMSIISAEFR